MSEEYIKTDFAINKGILQFKLVARAMRLSHVEHIQVSSDVDEGGAIIQLTFVSGAEIKIRMTSNDEAIDLWEIIVKAMREN